MATLVACLTCWWFVLWVVELVFCLLLTLLFDLGCLLLLALGFMLAMGVLCRLNYLYVIRFLFVFCRLPAGFALACFVCGLWLLVVSLLRIVLPVYVSFLFCLLILICFLCVGLLWLLGFFGCFLVDFDCELLVWILFVLFGLFVVLLLIWRFVSAWVGFICFCWLFGNCWFVCWVVFACLRFEFGFVCLMFSVRYFIGLWI